MVVQTCDHPQYKILPTNLYNYICKENSNKDVLVDSDEMLLEEANRSINEFLRVPAKARNITKKIIRGPLIQKFETTRDEITKFGVEQLQDPVTQEIMGKYLANLGKKK